MNRFLYKGMHHGGNGRVEDKRDKEEEGKDSNYGNSAQEKGGVVLDGIQTGWLWFILVNIGHGGICNISKSKVLSKLL